MTDREAGELLLDFPKRWDGLQAVREQRQVILDEYKSAAAYDGSRMGQGSHSDQTGKKAGRLAELGGQDAVLFAPRCPLRDTSKNRSEGRRQLFIVGAGRE